MSTTTTKSAAERIHEIELKMAPFQTSTAPHNPAFPNQNQSKHCWSLYTAAYSCAYDHDWNEGDAWPKPCEHFFVGAFSHCPNHWREQWDQQRQAGTFPLYPQKKKAEQ